MSSLVSRTLAAFSRVLLACVLLATVSVADARQIGFIDFSGFVQTSWQGGISSKQHDFRIDEVQLQVGKSWQGKASFMLRMNYRHVDVFGPTGDTLPLDYNKFIEQAWVSIDLLQKEFGLTFTLGKFALPIGYESINIPEMYQFSRSFTVDVGTPNFGTGIKIDWKKAIFDFSIYAITGWNTITDNNDAKTFGGRLGFSILDGDLRFGVSYVAGPEPIPNRPYSNVRSPRHVLDFDIMYTGVRRLTLAAELNYGYEDRASQFNPDKRARWLSFLTTIHYKFLPWLAGTFRYEHADDPDASRFYMSGAYQIGAPTEAQWFGKPQTIESFTLAGLFTVTEGIQFLLEWRTDWAVREEDLPVFPAADGGITKTRHRLAVGLYCSW